jgi:transposase
MSARQGGASRLIRCELRGDHDGSHVSFLAAAELTGMVDLSTDENGQVRARLLDLVQGRTKAAYTGWLTKRGEDFTGGVDVATLDPFQGNKSAVDEELAEATAVLDAFQFVALGTKCVDEVRRRVQQATTGHRGRKGDPL